MYATRRRIQVNPGTVEEITRRVEAGYVPLVKGTSGFVAFALEHQGDIMSTFTVFTTREAAEEANKQAAGWVRENLAGLVAGPLEMTVGEVVIHVTT